MSATAPVTDDTFDAERYIATLDHEASTAGPAGVTAAEAAESVTLSQAVQTAGA